MSDGVKAPATLDFEKARLMQPDYVTFNGYANQYKDHPLTAKPGDTLRFGSLSNPGGGASGEWTRELRRRTPDHRSSK